MDPLLTEAELPIINVNMRPEKQTQPYKLDFTQSFIMMRYNIFEDLKQKPAERLKQLFG